MSARYVRRHPLVPTVEEFDKSSEAKEKSHILVSCAPENELYAVCQAAEEMRNKLSSKGVGLDEATVVYRSLPGLSVTIQYIVLNYSDYVPLVPRSLPASSSQSSHCNSYRERGALSDTKFFSFFKDVIDIPSTSLDSSKQNTQPSIMAPTSQELSLLLHPIVPDSLAHNTRVSYTLHDILPPLHLRPNTPTSTAPLPLALILKPNTQPRLQGPIQPPLPHFIPPRHLRRNPQPRIPLRLRILHPRQLPRLPTHPFPPRGRSAREIFPRERR